MLAATVGVARTLILGRRQWLRGAARAFGAGAAASVAPDAALAATTGHEPGDGVLYDTRRGIAMPASPQTMAQLLDAAVLGPGGLQTRGVLCVAERHDCFEHHTAQLYTIKSLRRALRKRDEASPPIAIEIAFKSCPGLGSFRAARAKGASRNVSALDRAIALVTASPSPSRYAHTSAYAHRCSSLS